MPRLSLLHQLKQHVRRHRSPLLTALTTRTTTTTTLATATSLDLQKLRETLDDHIVGQQDTKEAFLLGLLAREHIYLEGPPGVAKTMIAEIASLATSLDGWFYQMHRDTRLNELIGESVIVRSQVDGVGEQIKHDVIKGGVLTCEIAVLDDISRAPGEALNVLLRILQERKFGAMTSEKIPLMSAIATGNPVGEDGYYGDPLDPATLDRFTLQLKSTGLVASGDWKQAKDVIDLYSGPRTLDDDPHVHKIKKSVVKDACSLVPLVVFSEEAKNVLLRLLRVLQEEYHCKEDNSLLTDRTFLVKAVSIMKANAILNGRHVSEPNDLKVLRYMTTFRVPEAVHEQIDAIIERVIAQEEQENGGRGGDGSGSNEDDDNSNNSNNQ
jgi:MoxR-like ATPase